MTIDDERLLFSAVASSWHRCRGVVVTAQEGAVPTVEEAVLVPTESGDVQETLLPDEASSREDNL